jgi:hypothetical protein
MTLAPVESSEQARTERALLREPGLVVLGTGERFADSPARALLLRREGPVLIVPSCGEVPG